MTVSSVCRALFVAPLALLGLVACSGTTTNPDSGVPVVPSNATVTITSPAEGDTVTLDATATIAVEFQISGFTLKEIGTCGEDPDCGHAELLVDGYQCDAPGLTYNNASATPSVLAKLSTCPSSEGTHRLTVELHHDDGSVVVGQSGRFVADTVTVTSSAPPPALSIASPADGSTVFMGPDLAVDIGFAVQNLTLTSAPGQCNGNPACGMLILNVDGNACNDGGAPGPVNNFGATSGAITARLDLCAAAEGQHTATLMVLSDDGQTPLMVDGHPLMAEVAFEALLAPTLTITSPAEGATVTLGGDSEKSVPVEFNTTHLTLTPNLGQCGGDPRCGVLTLTIDNPSPDCNNPNLGGAPFNNLGVTTTPINALFGYCPTPTGAHSINLTVFDESGMVPLMVNGVPLSVDLPITTQ